jgi:hypothetical protein
VQIVKKEKELKERTMKRERERERRIQYGRDWWMVGSRDFWWRHESEGLRLFTSISTCQKDAGRFVTSQPDVCRDRESIDTQFRPELWSRWPEKAGNPHRCSMARPNPSYRPDTTRHTTNSPPPKKKAKGA